MAEMAEMAGVEAAATRNFSALFEKVKCLPLHADLARDIETAMRELAWFCDETFPPHETQELHTEMREIAASMGRKGFVCPERLTQFAGLRATVERLWSTRPRNALSRPRRAEFTPSELSLHEHTRVLLRLDLALVRLKVQVLLQQIQSDGI